MTEQSTTSNGRQNTLVLAVDNDHSPQCGVPPAIVHRAGDGNYVGFFANSYGEQWVVEIDRQTKTGILRGGDIGWDTAIEIADGQVHGDLILGQDEKQWLAACWRAAMAGRPA